LAQIPSENYQNLALNSQPYSSSMSAVTITSPKYVFSRYFIIKSYTEDDVHKAIKYNIWSSTQKGN
jgi:hypothetical protein